MNLVIKFANACENITVLLDQWSEARGPIPYNEQNFDLDKSRQTFHHSLEEHHKISNIPKFRFRNVVKCG